VAGAIIGTLLGDRLSTKTRNVVTDALGLMTLLVAGLSIIDITKPEFKRKAIEISDSHFNDSEKFFRERNLDKLICADLTYRYNYNKGKTYESDILRTVDYVIPNR
jgi:hypothetical protein